VDTEENVSSDYIFKVVAIGDAMVGKTALIQRYATSQFKDSYITTMGMNLVTKNIELDDLKVEYCLWDIAGQPSFSSIVPMYYQGALGAFVVFDMTRKVTFDNVGKWLQELKQHTGVIPIILLGNKNDLTEKFEVTKEEIDQKIEELSEKWTQPIRFFETSAKIDYQVTDAFVNMADSILQLVKEEDEDDDDYGFL
jgi:Ras-related protein Rab-11A